MGRLVGRYKRGLRVRVHQASHDSSQPAQLCGDVPGTVVRVNHDGSAWIALDERNADPDVHPFPADASNGRDTWVRCWIGDCYHLDPQKPPASLPNRKADDHE